MTSSEDNRVSIPPKGQKSVCQIPGAVIHPKGLESGCQMTGVVFHLNNWLFIHSVDFYRFFCWKPAPVHKTYMYPLSDFVQEYRFSVFLAAQSCQILEFNNLESVPLSGGLQGFKD